MSGSHASGFSKNGVTQFYHTQRGKGTFEMGDRNTIVIGWRGNDPPIDARVVVETNLSREQLVYALQLILAGLTKRIDQ